MRAGDGIGSENPGLDGIAPKGMTKSGLIDKESCNFFVDRLNFMIQWVLKPTLDGFWININAVAGEKNGREKRSLRGASLESNLVHDLAMEIINVDDITERLLKASRRLILGHNGMSIATG